MRQDRKIEALEREIGNLRKENSDYKSVHNALTERLKHTQAELEKARDEILRLEEENEKILNECSEETEKMVEARLAYEEALKEIKTMMKEYRSKMDRMISDFKKTERAV